ncbi:MAG: hypothetical protein ABIR80_13320 [Opitutaceae bacterium]
MPSWFPRSIFGLGLTVVYLAVAVYAVIDARSNQGGGWISLKGIGVTIVTLPISFLGEVLGMKPDYRRNLDMAFAIGTCALLVYFAGAGLARLARALFAGANEG